ncbi:MAG: 50S ribosomal protein L24 [Alphaproteobacteria bacterium]|nr:50S ribosomal protein L24 [Alphaproteobacteria bacterium]
MTAPKFKIRKGDTVVVLAGKDKGKKGEVKHVDTAAARVTVAGVNQVTKHRKPSQAGAGGVEKIEKSLHISNVALLDPKSGKPTRVGYKTVGDRKVRVAKRSGEQME